MPSQRFSEHVSIWEYAFRAAAAAAWRPGLHFWAKQRLYLTMFIDAEKHAASHAHVATHSGLFSHASFSARHRRLEQCANFAHASAAPVFGAKL